MDTIDYAPGRSADLFGDPDRQTVLIWHGMQTDARAAVRPLASRIAEHGLHVIAPDWNSHAADHGRADLLSSAEFAADRQRGADGLILVGWSMGGVAAAGLTLHADAFGIRLRRTVCLAGAFMAVDPITGRHLPDPLPTPPHRTPFTLIHGLRDDAVPREASRDFAVALERGGWPVEFLELDADHGSIAGASYDAAHDQYVPADDPAALALVSDIATWIAA